MSEFMENEGMEMTNELMEVESDSSNKGIGTLTKVGLAVGLGYLAYRFGVKPLVKKFKNKKEQSGDFDNGEVVDVEYVEVKGSSDVKSDEKKK